MRQKVYEATIKWNDEITQVIWEKTHKKLCRSIGETALSALSLQKTCTLVNLSYDGKTVWGAGGMQEVRLDHNQ